MSGWPADLSVHRGREMGARAARVWTRHRRCPFAPGPTTKNKRDAHAVPSRQGQPKMANTVLRVSLVLWGG
jgi:hypothetical protein